MATCFLAFTKFSSSSMQFNKRCSLSLFVVVAGGRPTKLVSANCDVSVAVGAIGSGSEGIGKVN